MTVLSIIIGVLLIMCGISCIFTPALTFLSAGYFIIILFWVYGIMGVARGIATKNFGIDFFFSILSLIAGIVGFIYPGAAAMETNMIILTFAAIWFVLKGILSIMLSIQAKEFTGNTGLMVVGILLGVISILLGIYSFAHPFVLAIAIGLLIAFYFIESGISMIILALRSNG